jgi:hypothetical protein
MVMRENGTPVPTYDVLDEQGASIGRVILPRDSSVVGRGHGTVYLDRPFPRMQFEGRA